MPHQVSIGDGVLLRRPALAQTKEFHSQRVGHLIDLQLSKLSRPDPGSFTIYNLRFSIAHPARSPNRKSEIKNQKWLPLPSDL